MMNGVVLPQSVFKLRLNMKALEYYSLLQQDPAISYDDAAQRLGCKSRKYVYKLEDMLIKNGLVERTTRKTSKGERTTRTLIDPDAELGRAS